MEDFSKLNGPAAGMSSRIGLSAHTTPHMANAILCKHSRAIDVPKPGPNHNRPSRYKILAVLRTTEAWRVESCWEGSGRSSEQASQAA